MRLLAKLSIVGVVAAIVADILLAVRRGARQRPPIETLVVVDAPIARTWQVLSDIPGQPRWMREMKRVRLLDDGPTRVGTRGEAEVRILGINVTDPVEVTEFDPPTRFAIRHDGTFSGGGELALESGVDGDTTIVRWAERLNAPVLPDLADLVQRPVLRSIFQADLHRLRRLVESGDPDTEASRDHGPAA